jgi:hypothetical protein
MPDAHPAAVRAVVLLGLANIDAKTVPVNVDAEVDGKFAC